MVTFLTAAVTCEGYWHLEPGSQCCQACCNSESPTQKKKTCLPRMLTVPPPTEKDDKFPAFGEVAKLRRKPEIKATQVRTVCSQVSESQRKLAEQISTTPGCFDLCSSRVREVICPLLRCIQMLILG